jgi:hypothetical protein
MPAGQKKSNMAHQTIYFTLSGTPNLSTFSSLLDSWIPNTKQNVLQYANGIHDQS